MTRFRQALLDELLSRVTDPPAATVPTTRRPVRPTRLQLAFGGAALAVTAAAVVAVVLSPPTTTTTTPIQPAYAVTSEADGIVSVVTNRVGDPAAANQALRLATDDRVVIIPTSPPEDCPVADRGTKVPSDHPDYHLLKLVLQGKKPDNALRIKPGSIPVDWVLVLTPGHLPGGTAPVTWVNWYYAPGPRCVIDSPPDAPPQR